VLAVHTPQCLRDAAQKCRRLAAGILNSEIVDLLEKSAIEFDLRAIEMERSPSAGTDDAPPGDTERNAAEDDGSC
jgi:hypothetical protein